jgi:hypothetical protein
LIKWHWFVGFTPRCDPAEAASDTLASYFELDDPWGRGTASGQSVDDDRTQGRQQDGATRPTANRRRPTWVESRAKVTLAGRSDARYGKSEEGTENRRQSRSFLTITFAVALLAVTLLCPASGYRRHEHTIASLQLSGPPWLI